MVLIVGTAPTIPRIRSLSSDSYQKGAYAPKAAAHLTHRELPAPSESAPLLIRPQLDIQVHPGAVRVHEPRFLVRERETRYLTLAGDKRRSAFRARVKGQGIRFAPVEEWQPSSSRLRFQHIQFYRALDLDGLVRTSLPRPPRRSLSVQRPSQTPRRFRLHQFFRKG